MMNKVLLIVALSFTSLLATAQQKGQALYAQHCQTCHQADGTGAQNMIPPLTRTEYVLGPKPALVNLLLKGLSGEIKVNGDTYAGEMPSQAALKDDEIAAILSYVRESFGNKASNVTAAEVKQIRKKLNHPNR